jgi:aspartate/methionine/tyrosine aminotransferase
VVARRRDRGWQLDLEAVAERAGTGGGPTHLFFTTPHNPTGAVTAADDLVRLAAIAAERGGVLVSNEVYMEFAQPEERVHAFALAPNAISIGSLTKAYGLGSLRVGWMILGEGLRDEKERLTDYTYVTYVDPPTVALRAAGAALDNIPGLLAPLRELERTSRPLLARWLAECELVDGECGRFGLHAFPRVLGVDDTAGLAEHLAHDHGVDVVPGEHFGAPGHVRLGWGVPPATLEPALERLEQGIRACV